MWRVLSQRLSSSVPRSVSSRFFADSTTTDAAEVAKFAEIANRWWQVDGPMAPLHRMNAVRMKFIRQVLCTHFNRDPFATKPLEGLKLLDIGCGAGIATECLARLGANVLGVDAAFASIEAAKYRVLNVSRELQGKIDYQCNTIEELSTTESFDATLALEVIEHVSDPALFVEHCAKSAKELLIMSCPNRTPASAVLGVFAAEYILNWLPAGTHDFKRFVTPVEMETLHRQFGFEPFETTGLGFDPLKNEFKLTASTQLNFIMASARYQQPVTTV